MNHLFSFGSILPRTASSGVPLLFAAADIAPGAAMPEGGGAGFL